MRDEKIIELIQKSLDGIISKSENQQLQRILEKDPEMQSTFRHLQQVSGLLDAVPELDPPPGLSKRIMNSIDLSRYPKGKMIPAAIPSIRGLSTRMSPRMVVAFSVGVLATIIIFLVTQDHRDVMPESSWKDYYGTIGINERLGFETRTKIPVDEEAIQGSISYKQSDTLVGLEIDLQTNKDFHLRIEYETHSIQWNGLKPLNTLPFGIESGNNQVNIHHNADLNVLLFFMRIKENHPPINLSLIRSKKMVWQGKIGDSLSVDQ
ncbi:anti-sigma factor family protein [bacterium]